MELGKRLSAVLNLIDQSEVIADVGCDHGYISITLLERQICHKVIAMDVNKGPLLRAKENVNTFSMTEDIDLRLSDGVTALQEGEADGMVCAGMGGKLTLRILKDGGRKVQRMSQLILQPQSELALVRRTLYQWGYSFLREDMVYEDGKYYPMFAVRYTASVKKNFQYDEELVYHYGEYLLAARNPVLLDYLQKEEDHYCLLKEEVLAHAESPLCHERISELEERLHLNRLAQEIFLQAV